MSPGVTFDQAAGLRRMLGPAALRVLPLVSPLPGAAQAALALRLAAGLAQVGNRVVLLDGSRGEVARALGLKARSDLLQLLEGRKEFAEVALAAPEGLRVVPAADGIDALERMGGAGYAQMFGAFAALREPADLVLLNCAPGDAGTARRAAGAGRDLVLALRTDAASVTGAYALIKSVRHDDKRERDEAARAAPRRFRLLFADAARAEAAPLFARMREAARRFLEVELADGGAIPGSASADACRNIADASFGWQLPEYERPA